MVFYLLLHGPACAHGPEEHQGYTGDIFISLPESEKALKMPPALFLHDIHVSARQMPGCIGCHPKGSSGSFVFSFKKENVPAGKQGMRFFHQKCVGCHKERKKEGKSFGPLAGKCRDCHKSAAGSGPGKGWLSMRFNRPLHFLHEAAGQIKPLAGNDKNCGACHHVYDSSKKKIVYVPGKEGSCRYCHKPGGPDKAMPFPDAAHLACVNCHVSLKEKDQEAGPVRCGGCHSTEGQARMKKSINEKLSSVRIPRISRNQPDAALMAAWLVERKPEKPPVQRVRAVAFGHLFHEGKVDTCRKCHHESLESCSKCHTLAGDKKGNMITIASAMHDRESQQSCIGCHLKRTLEDPACAGCHGRMTETVTDAGNDCSKCHEIGFDAVASEQWSREAFASIAARQVDYRMKSQLVPVEKGSAPEKVTIGILSKKYEAAVFPHRKVMEALYGESRKNRLASVFHGKESLMCAGCHHHGPKEDLTPPGCVSCHGVTRETARKELPGLKAAYHGLCIECHRAMGIGKPAATDCTACHREKPTS